MFSQPTVPLPLVARFSPRIGGLPSGEIAEDQHERLISLKLGTPMANAGHAGRASLASRGLAAKGRRASPPPPGIAAMFTPFKRHQPVRGADDGGIGQLEPIPHPARSVGLGPE